MTNEITITKYGILSLIARKDCISNRWEHETKMKGFFSNEMQDWYVRYGYYYVSNPKHGDFVNNMIEGVEYFNEKDKEIHTYPHIKFKLMNGAVENAYYKTNEEMEAKYKEIIDWINDDSKKSPKCIAITVGYPSKNQI